MNQQRAIELAKKWNEEHHYIDPIKWVAMDENLRWFGYPNEHNKRELVRIIGAHLEGV